MNSGASDERHLERSRLAHIVEITCGLEGFKNVYTFQCEDGLMLVILEVFRHRYALPLIALSQDGAN